MGKAFKSEIDSPTKGGIYGMICKKSEMKFILKNKTSSLISPSDYERICEYLFDRKSGVT